MPLEVFILKFKKCTNISIVRFRLKKTKKTFLSFVLISIEVMLDHLFCHQLWLCPMIFYPNVIHLGTYMLFPIVVSTIWCNTAQSFIDFSSLRKSSNDDLSKLINRNKKKTRRKPELIGFINTSIGSPWKSPSVRLSQT